ncbi:MAG: penicillin-insensitive murein endopeptidase [Candidatus Coatesbacteria bacterium]|nr:penicillin-insensitive murein endopeptidase [Candidatus Coatesbacteria bacterium]
MRKISNVVGKCRFLVLVLIFIGILNAQKPLNNDIIRELEKSSSKGLKTRTTNKTHPKNNVKEKSRIKKTKKRISKKNKIKRRNKWKKKKRIKKKLPFKAFKKTASGALGQPFRGRLAVNYKLRPSRNYIIKNPERHFNYGTRWLISTIVTASARYKRSLGKSFTRIVVGDLSKKGGGPLGGHNSHQNGLDVDIGIPAKGLHLKGFTSLPNSRIDMRKTLLLLKSFIDTGRVQVIFIDSGIKAGLYKYINDNGLTRYKKYLNKLYHEPGHRDHMHVRLRNPG